MITYSKRPNRTHDFSINVESMISTLEMLIWITEPIDINNFYGFYCIEKNWDEGAASEIKMEDGKILLKHDRLSSQWLLWDEEGEIDIVSSYRKLIFNEIELILLG
jgi:hypothetical protein